MDNWRADGEQYAGPLTEALKRPGGEQTLRPIQAAALVALIRNRHRPTGRGVFVSGRVGTGKTMIAALAPRVCAAARPLTLVPGGSTLRGTEAHLGELRKHWDLHPGGMLLSYSLVSNMPRKGTSIGCLWGGRGPDMIICDEADKLRRVGISAVGQQIAGWMKAHPDTTFVWLTATSDVEGIPDYAHGLYWCLGDASPVPADPARAAKWSAVIDQGDETFSYEVARDLGVPRQAELKAIRNAFRTRVRSTPGVIVHDEAFSDVECSVTEIQVEDPQVAPHWERLRTLWQRPDGADLLPEDAEGQADADRPRDRVTGFGCWGVARQMARGFCYVWDPRPPEEWLAARRAYFSWVRRSILAGHYLTEAVARAAAEAAGLSSAGGDAWARWRDIEPTFEPQTKTLWLGSAALDAAEKWGRADPSGGVIWTEHNAFARELSRRTGWGYYGGGGLNAAGEHIAAISRPGVVAIASRKANGQGLNLQYEPPRGAGWHRCLFAGGPPTNSRDFEQPVGRFHREGQTFDVEVACLVACSEDIGAREKTLAAAERTEDSFYSAKAAAVPWSRVTGGDGFPWR